MCDGVRVAPLTFAILDFERSQGLLGLDAFAGAILLEPAHLVHSFGMRFAIDVAFCDRDLRVFAVVTLGRNRLARPRVRSRAVVEASAGAFRRWGVTEGSRLAVEEP